MKKLIVNADDFGLHKSVNDGIVRGHRDGIITSASLMCGGDAFDDAAEQAKKNPELGIGLHLTLVGCKPVQPLSRVRSLADEQGQLPADYVCFAKHWYSGKIMRDELISELSAQMEKGMSCGLNITHVDSHQHIHVLPGITDIVLKLCSDFGIKRIRMPREGLFWRGSFQCGIGRLIGRTGLSCCSMLAGEKAQRAGMVYPDYFFGMLAGGNLNEFLIGEIIKNLPEGVSEIMTHPGLNKEVLEQKFTWQYHWEDELQGFLSEKNKRLLERQQITLINFGGL